MRNSGKLHISTHDLQSETPNPLQLWTGPSSPPFHHTPLSVRSLDHHDSLAASPSTPSDFEFDSIFSSLKIKDDPPLSPTLIPSSTAGYWGAAVPLFDARPHQKIARLSHPSTAAKQLSASPSPSVRQLMEEEISSENDDDFSLDFYSAPQTPMHTHPRRSTPVSEEGSLSQDEASLSAVAHAGRRTSSSALLDRRAIGTSVGQRKSNSSVLDRRAHDELGLIVTQNNQLLHSSQSEPNSDSALWTSSFAWEKNEEVKNGAKKQGSKSCVKWAFKDLLRRTVPSSKAEAHYITKAMGTSSLKKYLSSSKSNPNMSPLASPMHSTSKSTPEASRPSTPGQSLPPHPSTSAWPPGPSLNRTPRPSRPHGPSKLSHESPPRRPSTPSRPPMQSLNPTPTPSPPRSPLSPHAIHYQQNKAQSLELTKKTFLPYRQSLLGCIGGPGAFLPEQQAW